MDPVALADPFPLASVSWRVQGSPFKGRDGWAARALAYIDARDVMERLDAVCGPAGWQDRYEVHGSKTICYLSIRCGDEWVTKADGAGDTQVEAEKGSLSDAFKRAAVKWGIGRYLYAVEAPWVACEVTEKSGKTYWKRWTEDPWSKVKRVPAPAPVQSTPALAAPRENGPDYAGVRDHIKARIARCVSLDDLVAVWKAEQIGVKMLEAERPPMFLECVKAKDEAKALLPERTPMPDMEMPGAFVG